MDVFWDGQVSRVPLVELQAIIRCRFPGLTELQYHKDDGRIFTWVYQGLCGALSLEDPDGWFVIGVWRYLDRGL
jgi:hypothetical protein